MDKLNLILEANAEAFVETIQEGLAKAGLAGSKLYQSVRQEVNSGVLKIYMYDYAKYVLSGRKAGAKKVPISVLINWIKAKGIAPKAGQSVNSLAFAIQNGIYKTGIKGRQFISKGATIALVRNIGADTIKLTIDYLNEELKNYTAKKK